MFIVQDPRTCVVLLCCMSIIPIDNVRCCLLELMLYVSCNLLFLFPLVFSESVSQGEPDPTCAQRVFDPMAPKDGPGGRKVSKGLL